MHARTTWPMRSKATGRAPLELARLHFTLHRAVNDALTEAPIEMIALGKKTRADFIDASIEDGEDAVEPGDHPINLEGADFRAGGGLLLGLRYPTSADGCPVMVELEDVGVLFGADAESVRATAVWTLDGIGSPDGPVGIRGLHSDDGVSFDAVVGDVDVDEHPEGGAPRRPMCASAWMRRRRAAAPWPACGRCTSSATSATSRAWPAAADGHVHYVVDRDGRVAAPHALCSTLEVVRPARDASAAVWPSPSPRRFAMESTAAAGSAPAEPVAAEAAVDPFRALGRFWWLWLVFGVFWILVALVVLQFDQASIATVGVLIGAMFLATSAQQFMLGALASGATKWILWIFAVFFLAAGIISLISPEDTFAGVADILGFLFLLVGVFWIIQAFVERDANELWWLGLISGIAMIILAFWTAGQFFMERAFLLLVFAGIWALFQGVGDIVKAFQIRKLRDAAP